MLGTALRQLILLVPLAYLFASRFGVERVWFAMWISEGVAMIYAIWASRMTLKRKTMPCSPSSNSIPSTQPQ
jgi:Na+-driven multidrug efflux pump